MRKLVASSKPPAGTELGDMGDMGEKGAADVGVVGEWIPPVFGLGVGICNEIPGGA